METAISFINIMPDTKSGIQLFVDKVLAEVEVRKALPLLAKLTAMEKIIEGIKDGIKEQILDEASLEGEKSFSINGVKYEKKSRATHYYNHCSKHEELKGQLKTLEDLMKVIKAPVADADTGELIEPARTSYSDYVAITLPK